MKCEVFSTIADISKMKTRILSFNLLVDPFFLE